MSDTTTRALSLLNLLQTHRHWPGTELAERLGVTERTVRRDVERLRELGYRIESTPGAAGGYRLEAGSAVPPLLLTDEEAVAMAIGLRVAAAQRLVGGPETTLTALAKLEQVLPAPLRRRVNALADAVQPAGIRAGAAVSTEVLGELALACRDHERVRFTYTAASGEVIAPPRRAARARARRPALVPAVLGPRAGRLAHLPRRPARRTSSTPACSSSRGRSPPSRSRSSSSSRASWVRTAVETDVVMDLPIDAMRDAFGPVGAGRRRRGRRPDAVAGRRRRTSARRCTGWRGCPAGSSTRPISPNRRAPSCARRSSGCCAHWMPRRRRSVRAAPRRR